MKATAQKSGNTGKSKKRLLNAHVLIKIAGLVLAGVLVWLLVRAADWRSVAGELRRSNIYLLFCTWVFVGGSSWLLRAARWRLLLSAENHVGFWPVFWANSAGNLTNIFLPARAGEFIRSAMIGAGFGLSQRFVLATAACERILDLLIFVSMAEIVVWFGANVPVAILQAINFAFLLATAGFAILYAASRATQWINLVVDRLLGRPLLANRINEYLEPVMEGLRTIHGWKQASGFIGLTAFIWLLDVSGAKLVAYAMGFALPFTVAFVLITGLVFINLIPATPGQLGIYQWVVISVLTISHIEYNQALAFSLVMQASGYLVLFLLGVPGLLVYRKSRPKKDGPTITAPDETKGSRKWLQDPQ